MIDIFKYVDKFFTSLTNYLTYNYIFIIFVGLFLFTALCVAFFTSRSYEARLIKAIDKFNVYFIDNPHINEENLVAFNAKMKSKKVPKQLRKNWQQFVLYREGKASSYMSFENCVSNPIKNSTFKRDLKTMNTFAWIFSLSSIVLNAYYCYETSDLAVILRTILLAPIIIILINCLFQIFLNLRHSAIVSDLLQNYQYFEVNIDKATETLPEYVDYEVLFDKNEIKKGIPILYAYLQKRAEEEQRELERARLKNVEHEKFNFDDQGVAASLVLERAMQEAENYIAERKKYNQDIGQINSDMTQEDLNYREITKEYNRQMQVSKETFENFKAQLNEVSSSIEANYLKKQQQQELDRQRNLERDFDTATERHKKIIEDFQAELDSVDKFIAESRKNLENAMKSEFGTYSSKVYDEAKKLVEERQRNKENELKQTIEDLEELLVSKNQELENIYQQNQLMSDKLEEIGIAVNDQPGYAQSFKPEEVNSQPVQTETYDQETYGQETYDQETYDQETPVQAEPVQQETQPQFEPVKYEQPKDEDEDEEPAQEVKPEFEDNKLFKDDDEDNLFNINSDDKDDIDDMIDEKSDEKNDELFDASDDSKGFEDYFDFESENDENTSSANEEKKTEDKVVFLDDSFDDDTSDDFDYEEDFNDEKISTESNDDSIEQIKPESRRGRPRKVVDEAQTQGEKKKPGRPRKEHVEENKPKRSVGRPRKEASKTANTGAKKGPGRPRKEKVETEEVKRSVGRPRKEAGSEKVSAVKKGRGRPKKLATQEAKLDNKRGRGRPRKDVSQAVETRDVENLSDIKEIDEYLRQIDNQIAAENAKLEESQRELAKRAKIRGKK